MNNRDIRAIISEIFFGALHYDADLAGIQVQHDMMPFYVRKDVLDDLLCELP
jgi:hypothetical protein